MYNVCGIEVNHPQLLLTFGACLSVLCLSVIFALYYYYKVPNIRKYPTNLVIHKCVLEVLFVSQYLWMFFVPLKFFWKNFNHGDDEFKCTPNPNIWPFSWLTQFSLLGGELWFAVLSANIHVQLTNPFASTAATYTRYRIFVYGFAALMATILVNLVPIRYGLSSDPMIWITDEKRTLAYTKIFFFYGFMGIIYLYCGAVAIWARNQVSRGLDETLKIRKYTVSKQTRYVIGYFCFWSLVFTLQFFLFVSRDTDLLNQQLASIFRTMSSFLLASRGVWSLGIFVWANRQELEDFFKRKEQLELERRRNHEAIETLSKRAEDTTATIEQRRQSQNALEALSAKHLQMELKEDEQIQLNVALMKEIVMFTALGIRKATRKARRVSVSGEQADQHLDYSGSWWSCCLEKPLPGQVFSFTLIDPAAGKGQSFQNNPRNSSESFSSTSGQAINPLMQALSATEGSATLNLQQSTNQQGDGEDVNSDTEEQADAADWQVHSGDPRGDVESNRGSEVPYGDKKRADVPNSFEMRGPSSDRPSMQERPSQGSWMLPRMLSDGIRQAKIAAHKQSFAFLDFSPKIFARIRQVAGISQQDYITSFRSTTMPSFSEGRSGAFLYFSSDYKYIVKTTVRSEFEKLLTILPDYAMYLEDQLRAGNRSFITYFLGAHKIVMYDIPIYFVVMKNVLPSVDEKYDLKGSWVNRYGSRTNKDLATARPKKHYVSSGNMVKPKKGGSTPLFLDNDLQNCFSLSPSYVNKVAEQLLRDASFMEKFNLMDYSLLVGVRRRNFEILDTSSETGSVTSIDQSRLTMTSNSSSLAPSPPPAAAQKDTLYNPYGQDPDGAFNACVVEGQGTFYIGIIDILQEWNWSKWMERMFKVYVLRKDAAGLSAIDATSYRKRFFKRAVLDVFDGVDESLGYTAGDDECPVGDEESRNSSSNIPSFENAYVPAEVSFPTGNSRVSSLESTSTAGFRHSASIVRSSVGSGAASSVAPTNRMSLPRDSNVSSNSKSNMQHFNTSSPTPPDHILTGRDSLLSANGDKRFLVKRMSSDSTHPENREKASSSDMEN